MDRVLHRPCHPAPSAGANQARGLTPLPVGRANRIFRPHVADNYFIAPLREDQMPLSDSERRRLEALADDLSADDPRLALKLGSGSAHHMVGMNALLGSMIVAAGIIVLLIGVGIQAPPVGVAGYLIMLGGAYWAVSQHQRRDRTH